MDSLSDQLAAVAFLHREEPDTHAPTPKKQRASRKIKKVEKAAQAAAAKPAQEQQASKMLAWSGNVRFSVAAGAPLEDCPQIGKRVIRIPLGNGRFFTISTRKQLTSETLDQPMTISGVLRIHRDAAHGIAAMSLEDNGGDSRFLLQLMHALERRKIGKKSADALPKGAVFSKKAPRGYVVIGWLPEPEQQKAAA
jgi:hypothetical protein